MKAQWDNVDYTEMEIRPLSFAAEDVEWIRIGIARREATGSAGEMAQAR